jgi:hypothetical protein
MADFDRPVGRGGFLGPADGSLRDLLEKLRLTYCQMLIIIHIPDWSV